jgi:hypothetical protein
VFERFLGNRWLFKNDFFLLVMKKREQKLMWRVVVVLLAILVLLILFVVGNKIDFSPEVYNYADENLPTGWTTIDGCDWRAPFCFDSCVEVYRPHRWRSDQNCYRVNSECVWTINRCLCDRFGDDSEWEVIPCESSDTEE